MPDLVTPERPTPLTEALLDRITRNSLDEDYAASAQRRAREDASAPGPASTRRSWWGVVAVVAVFGLLVSVSFEQNAASQAGDEASRSELLARIQDQRRQVADQQDQLDRLRTDETRATDSLAALRSAQATTAARLVRLASVTGFGAVTGPGIRIVVSDPSNAQDAVRDTDLRTLVNGLWQVGVEAVSINGQRLTPLSSIRNSGQVVNVNLVPLKGPYTILAIGDEKTLQADLVDSPGGQAFSSLVDYYGFGFTMQNVDRLALPAAPLRTLRAAAVAGQGGDAVAPGNRGGSDDGKGGGS